MSKYEFVTEAESATKPVKVLVTLERYPHGVNINVRGSLIMCLRDDGTLARYYLNPSDKEYIQSGPDGCIKNE